MRMFRLLFLVTTLSIQPHFIFRILKNKIIEKDMDLQIATLNQQHAEASWCIKLGSKECAARYFAKWYPNGWVGQ